MLRIVRNNIVNMNVDAIVNTSNSNVTIGEGCETSIYEAAGKELLLKAREAFGYVPEGDVFITSGFNLPARYIIHAVSPVYTGEESERNIVLCYTKSLKLAHENGLSSIAFPLISTGSFGCPKEVGLRLAIDAIKSSPYFDSIVVYLVVFDAESTSLASSKEDIQSYIDDKYTDVVLSQEYSMPMPCTPAPKSRPRLFRNHSVFGGQKDKSAEARSVPEAMPMALSEEPVEVLSEELSERMKHMSDPFGAYLMYLIDSKGMVHADVYKRAIVDKKVFSKIKNNPDYHPNKTTAMCLCVGAMLNLDESKDLLSRAGYALSPSDKTDIIFSYFLEKQIYDMIEIDIVLEEHGLPCIIN